MHLSSVDVLHLPTIISLLEDSITELDDIIISDELLSATLEEDSTTDDENGTSLDELSTDEDDSATLEELVSEDDDSALSEEDDSATTSEELLTAATSLEEDCTLLLDSFGVILEEDPCSLLDVNKNAYPSLLSITSSELLDVISPMGLVEDSVSLPHPTNDMHAAPASRQRMVALKAEKGLGREGRIWVVILFILHALLFSIFSVRSFAGSTYSLDTAAMGPYTYESRFQAPFCQHFLIQKFRFYSKLLNFSHFFANLKNLDTLWIQERGRAPLSKNSLAVPQKVETMRTIGGFKKNYLAHYW